MQDSFVSRVQAGWSVVQQTNITGGKKKKKEEEKKKVFVKHNTRWVPHSPRFDLSSSLPQLTNSPRFFWEMLAYCTTVFIVGTVEK